MYDYSYEIEDEAPWGGYFGYITSLTVEKNVTHIGEFAFYDCRNLTYVSIPDTIDSFGDCAFEKCENLTSVNITDIAAWCNIDFEYRESNPLYYANLYINGNLVTKLDIPDGVTQIKDYSFCRANFTSVDIPDSVTSIGAGAFENCENLTDISIPDSVASIGIYAFSKCIGITDINMPDGVTAIGDYAFSHCDGLTSVEIPDSVASLGEGVFLSCDKLIHVSVGNGVEIIPAYAFAWIDGLKYVCLSDNLTEIQDYAFDGCDNIEFVFYAGSRSQWSDIYIQYGSSIKQAERIYNATKRTYKLETNCDVILADITDYAVFTAPAVTNGELTLTGWYDNKALSGEPVMFPYYGEAETLYARWMDGSGESFDDAFITKVNQEYTVSTTESGQLVYFEFVPMRSKEYTFYTTGGKDTYGYLYDSDKSKLASNDDGGDEHNFLISYSLTAGETYYIAAKIYSGTGTFTFAIEEPEDYRINAITVKDMSGNGLSAIPVGTFLASVSFTNIASSEDTVIVLAQYSAEGVFKGLMYVKTKDMPEGTTMELMLPVDNTNGEVAKLKAFCWESLASATPLGNAVTFGAE